MSQRLGVQSTNKTYHRAVQRTLKKSRKRLVRYGLITANVALLGVVGFFVVGNQGSIAPIQQNAITANSDSNIVSPLDQLSSADIAVHVARMTNLYQDESDSITNSADSAKAQLSLASVDNSFITKPQVVGTALPSNKDIKRYSAQAGEKITDIAAKFSVTSDSIRWSNNISGDTVASARELLVPPVSGIVYTVQAGDTPESLARKYQASVEQIIAINDAEVGGLKVGSLIVIRDAVQPVVRAATSSYSYSYASSVVRPSYSANGYNYGYCTWHVANRRRDIGNPIPNNLGNAVTWYPIARNMGLAVGSEPRAGAVLWDANMGGLGHVGFVEKVNEDGSILVSDMNYPLWGRITYRTVPPSQFGKYRFIY